MDQTYKLIIDPTVQAVPITPETIDWAAGWCKGRTAKTFDPDSQMDKILGVHVVTQNGVKLAKWGWYIVKKLSGDFRVYDPRDFERKYQLVVKAES